MVNIWTSAWKKNLWTKSKFICVCSPLAWAAHAQRAGWLQPSCALHKLVRLCIKSLRLWTYWGRGSPSIPPLLLPKRFLLMQHPESYRSANAQQQACILRQCKGQQIFIPLGKAGQEESCGLRWLRWSLRCSLMLTWPVALLVHVKCPVTDKKVLRPVRTLLYLCICFAI